MLRLSRLLSFSGNQEFFRPIITPHELVTALSPNIDWPGHYTLNFSDVLAQDSLIRSGKWNNDLSALFSSTTFALGAAVFPASSADSVQQLDEGAAAELPAEGADDDDESDQPSFSLVSGTYRHRRRFVDQTGKQIPSGRFLHLFHSKAGSSVLIPYFLPRNLYRVEPTRSDLR